MNYLSFGDPGISSLMMDFKVSPGKRYEIIYKHRDDAQPLA